MGTGSRVERDAVSTRTAIAAAFVAMLLPATAGAQPAVSVESGLGNDQATTVTPLARPVDRGNSTDTLLVLHQPHSYGHATNTAERAGRAIQHLQVASLRLPATATAPAVRTTPPSTPPAVDRDVESIIRDVWPDELEDRALRIAYRESRYQPHVRTWCCFGVFEVHKMHLAWLCPEMGICSTDQLYDPTTNAQAAYALYRRDGWSPWSVN